jgi:hypothetical protein
VPGFYEADVVKAHRQKSVYLCGWLDFLRGRATTHLWPTLVFERRGGRGVPP